MNFFLNKIFSLHFLSFHIFLEVKVIKYSKMSLVQSKYLKWIHGAWMNFFDHSFLSSHFFISIKMVASFASSGILIFILIAHIDVHELFLMDWTFFEHICSFFFKAMNMVKIFASFGVLIFILIAHITAQELFFKWLNFLCTYLFTFFHSYEHGHKFCTF